MMIDPLDNLTSSEQLRRLLLQEEQDRIDKLEARLGDDEALKGSLVPIIADVLRDAGVQDYRRLAGALAPIVLQSIKTEIHNSRDMMVDALYPITGRLVAAAVRNAFKDLVDQLNTKMDSTLSVDRWRAKLKATVTGRSEAEVLLSEGAAFEIVDLLLIDRQSGLLIAQGGPDVDQGGMDSQLLGSILTAIMAFVRDAMSQSSEQDLRTLHVGDVRLHLQVSPGAILAIKTKGPPPAGFETSLSETFCAFLSRWGDVLSRSDQLENRDKVALTEDLEERFQTLLSARQSNFRQPSKKGTVILGALGLAAVLWIGWTVFDRWTGSRIEATARSVIAEQDDLTGYPIEARYRRDDETLAVSGLLPDQGAIETLRGRLETTLPDVAVAMDVGKLPVQTLDPNAFATGDDLVSRQQTLRADMVEMMDERLSAMSGAVARLETRLPEAAESAEAGYAASKAWFDGRSIRFLDDTALEDDVLANEMLEAVAARLSAMPPDIGLRVIGYGDDLGEDSASAAVSRTRAAVIAGRLLTLGVASERLRTVGRGREKRLGENDGPGSVNRRVEFELIELVEDQAGPGARSEADDGTR